eukprot:1337683-Prymnesium_polylepis.1
MASREPESYRRHEVILQVVTPSFSPLPQPLRALCVWFTHVNLLYMSPAAMRDVVHVVYVVRSGIPV